MASNAKKEEVIALHKKGLPLADIQQKTGVPRGTLGSWLTAHRKESGQDKPEKLAKEAKPAKAAKPETRKPAKAANAAKKEASPKPKGKKMADTEMKSLFTAGNINPSGYSVSEFKSFGASKLKYEFECQKDSFKGIASMLTASGWKLMLSRFDVMVHPVAEDEAFLPRLEETDKLEAIKNWYWHEFDCLLKLLLSQ